MLRSWLRLVALGLPAEERERWREEWNADFDALERRGAGLVERMSWAFGLVWAALQFRSEGASMDGWGREVRNAIRGLIHRPAFTAIAVLTLGLGVGANTAIFSVVNGVVLEPLRYPDSGELVKITTAFPQQGFDKFWMSPPEYMELESRVQAIEGIAGYRAQTVSVGGGEQPERVTGAYATASLFTVLGVQPAIGRAYTEDEDLPSASGVTVLSHEMWTRSFGSDPQIVGRSIEVNGSQTVVLGVMPKDFDLDDNGAELWLPVQIDRTNFNNRGSHFLEVVGRMRPGVTPAEAQRELTDLVIRWGEDSPGAGHVPTPDQHPIALVQLQEEVVADVRPALMVLLGAVGFVLLIACANVGNLLLVRAEDRQKEVAVRVALGAGRGRLMRQFLTEGVVLSGAGALVGIGIAWLSLQVLRAASPGDVPRLAEIDLDGTVLAVTSGVAIAVGIFFGFAPARHILSGGMAGALKDGGLRSTDTAGKRGLRSMLVISEMALALVLAVGAGLMIRSFEALNSVDPGFDAEGLLTFQLYLPPGAYPGATETGTFYAQLEEGMESRPEFEAVAFTSGLPPRQTLAANTTEIESIVLDPNDPNAQLPNIDYYTSVSADFVETLGLTLLEGRALSAIDDAGASPVIMINRAFAEKYFPDQSAVGQRVRPCCGDPTPWWEVVGVVDDVKQDGLDNPSGTELFMSHAQQGNRTMYVTARTRGDAAATTAAAREAVWALDASLPLAQLQPMTEVVGDVVARSRFLTGLMATFAGLALLLAAVGTYGVMSYSVAQRGRELGIRMAMGAEAGAVQRLVLGQGLRVAAIGLVVGVGGAWGLTGLLESLLFNVDARDPAAFIIGPVVLSMVAVAACWIPAIRATRVDPVTVLRQE